MGFTENIWHGRGVTMGKKDQEGLNCDWNLVNLMEYEVIYLINKPWVILVWPSQVSQCCLLSSTAWEGEYPWVTEGLMV